MAYPVSGLIKIFATDTVINSGQFALNSDAAPQPTRTAAQLDAYFDARVTNLAVAPCMSRNTEKPAASGIYVPAGGTYDLQFDPSDVGFQFFNGSYPSAVVATLNGLNANFPVGMVISSPLVYWSGQVYFGPSRDRNITKIDFKYFGSTKFTYTPPGSGLLTGTISTGVNDIITNPLERWSMFQVMRNFGISMPCDIVVSGLLNNPLAVTSECFILATYNTQKWSITTPTPNVMAGGLAIINDANSNLNQLDEDGFKIYWDSTDQADDVFDGLGGGITIPRANILTFTPSQFRFIMPSGVPYGGRRLMLVGTGTTDALLTGEFPLQNFNITLVDGSGVYTLVDDQHHDIYYDRSVTPVITTNVKIPDPLIKTGGFNG